MSSGLAVPAMPMTFLFEWVRKLRRLIDLFWNPAMIPMSAMKSPGPGFRVTPVMAVKSAVVTCHL